MIIIKGIICNLNLEVLFRKKLFMILMSVVLVCSLQGCGSQTEIVEETQDFSREVAESSEEQTEIEEESSYELQPQEENDEELNSVTSNFIADFDINKTYELKPEVKDASLADGAYVQIGDTVLKLGKATLRDFVNAGVDLYYEPNEYEPRNETINESRLNSWLEVEVHVIMGLIGNEVSVLLYPMPHEGLWTEDTPIGEIIFDIADLRYNSMTIWHNGRDEYAANYINENKVKDYYSIYSTGGLRLSGSQNDIPDGYGLCITDFEPDDRGYQMIKKDFVDNEGDPNNKSILIYGNDKCCYMEMNHFSNYSDVRKDYSGLTFVSKEEGAIYMEALQTIERNDIAMEQERRLPIWVH